ncbi:hypothetical protein D3C81_1034370 [compost metagenome]
MPRLASHHVIAEATGELALGAVHLAVQVVALHVADYLAVQVQLVQVAAAVVQMVDLAPVRQGQRGQVAERVVLVAQGSIGSDFPSQPAQQVVGVFQLLFGYTQLLTGHGWLALNVQQPITVVVLILLPCITVELGNQSTNRIALEQRLALRPLAIFAITDFINAGQVTALVVAETPRQVIHPHLFAQPIRGIVGKAVGRVVFVDQRGQADGLVVLVTYLLPFGILAAARQAPRCPLQAGDLALAVGVAEHLAIDVVGKVFRSAVRMVDAQDFTVRLALQRGGLLQRIGHRHQVLALIVAVAGTFARTVLIALDLGQGVPPQVLGLVVGIDDGVRQAIVAVQVLGQLAQGINLGEQVALVVVTRLPGAAVRVADLGHQGGQVVVFVGDLAAQWVRLFEQTGKFVVREAEPIAVRQT